MKMNKLSLATAAVLFVLATAASAGTAVNDQQRGNHCAVSNGGSEINLQGPHVASNGGSEKGHGAGH